MERTKNNQCSLQLTSYLIFAFMIWRPGACIKQKNVQGYKRGRVSLFLFLPLLPPTTTCPSTSCFQSGFHLVIIRPAPQISEKK